MSDGCQSFVGPYDGPQLRQDRPAVPWFDDVVAGMGSAPARLAGVVHARIEDDDGTDFTYRVIRDGVRVRCAALDGAVHVVCNGSTVWTRHDGTGRLMTEPVRGGFVPTPDDYEFGTRGTRADRWDGDDFTRPIGAPEQVMMLGRPAWRITLAPPRHKPEPMQLVVDRLSFVVLHDGNEAFGTFHEWVELDLDPDIDDHLFDWRDDDRLARRYQ